MMAGSPYNSAQQMTLRYRNPVWNGYMADPFVLQWQGQYYAYGTGSRQGNGRQPDGNIFPLLQSANLVRWRWIAGALQPLGDGQLSYWAPEVAERDGTFYLYYSAGGAEGEHHQLRVAVATTPVGPFIDSGRLLLPGEAFSIDAHPFKDPVDGRWYLFFSKDFFDGRAGTGVAGIRLADDMVTPASEVQTALRASADWQIFQRNRHWYDREWPAWHTVEGPFVVSHDGRYYCFYSGGNWKTAKYGIGYAVADQPLGPYRDEWSAHGPSVLQGSSPNALGPGHNSIAQTQGHTELLVYHAWNHEQTARRMFIDPLEWTPDGPRCKGPTTGLQTLRDS